ncbi:GRAM domain-containing protein 1A-like [Tropilaelaps mercedesae]|uniref:GRAM domain-containing protein 1A-like n=1 Tax=Tropilaelaps mercedesae TaxID=418985 RepID=A0A1V9XSP2_9ACAR|nr:GRAM domain-containing protein 1A-like [Tropilaelaps mercedesae]
MFAPPNVANAKAAQATQIQGFLTPTPKPGASQELPITSTRSSSAPTGPERPSRKKSDPFLSSSAPASVEGERVESVADEGNDVEVRRRRKNSQSTENTRAPSPVEGPLFASNVTPGACHARASFEPQFHSAAHCTNQIQFGQDEKELPTQQPIAKEIAASANKADSTDTSLPSNNGRDSKISVDKTAPTSMSASTVSLQLSQGSGGSGGKVCSPASTPIPETKKKTKKNRKSPWYQNLISPTYKSKCSDFRRLFSKEGVPESEMLIVDYSCALQRDILVHGRLYVSQNYLCFHANIFKWETCVVLKCRDLTSMTKEKTALVIPNAIVCQTENERYFFTSFAARDRTYLMLFRIWQNALLAQPMSTPECWRWVHYSYGDELGLSTDDEIEYVAPGDLTNCKIMDAKNLAEVSIDEGELAQAESPSLRSSANTNTAKTSATSSIVVSEDAKSSASSADELEEYGSATDKRAETPECPESHEGMKQYLDRSFAMDIDHLFTCIFTASEFYQDLQASRKISNLTIGNWERLDDTGVSISEEIGPAKPTTALNTPGVAQCKQKRHLTYTVNLNLTMAKSCVSSETQSLHRKSKPGKMYSIRSEVSNTGIPYADAFVVQQHYCIRREDENRCRLKIYAQIDFRKPPWGFVKGMIEKNTHQGVSEFVGDLQKALDKEAQRLADDSGRVVLPITPDAQASTTSPILSSEQAVSLVDARNAGTFTVPNGDCWPASWVSQWIDPTTLLKTLTVFVGFLLVLNIYLVYSNWTLTNRDDSMILLDFGNRPPTTVEQWSRAYEESQVRHRRQLEEVKHLVERTLGGLDNMRSVFAQLKDIIAQRANRLPTSASAISSHACVAANDQSTMACVYPGTENSAPRGEL